MMTRLLAIALCVPREAVRTRLLHALSALGLGGILYAFAVGAVSPHEAPRVVGDLGVAAISSCAALLAIALGAGALTREIAQGAIAPLLTRALRRHEYFIGKYLGMLLTLATFVALQGAVLLGVLSLASGGAADRRLVAASCALALSEAAIVAAITSFFASFSTPYPTAAFTFGLFVLGRNADALQHQFRWLGHIVPNLQVYVPSRALLLGDVAESPVWSFVARAALNAALYAVVLVTAGALLFRRRDLA